MRITRLTILLQLSLIGLTIVTSGLPAAAAFSDGTVFLEQKISDTAGGFGGTLDDIDVFGFSVARLGDLDGDGVTDLAVGAYQDDDGGTNRGAVWIVFLNSDGTVKAEQKISDTIGGFTGTLNNFANFGVAVAGLGDLDGDTIPDLAVGVPSDGADLDRRGAVWILFLNSNGTVKAEQKISDTVGGFGGMLETGSNVGDHFGNSLANLGDLDGDGITDLAVGAFRDDDGGLDTGAVWILFLNSNGTVKAEQKISATVGGFGGFLDDVDGFGLSTATLGDLDDDGVTELAVGVPSDDDGGTNTGAVWILFLNSNGTVKAEQKISATAGGFASSLAIDDNLGRSVAGLGDLDGDGTRDLAAGANSDNDGGPNRGAVWILFLNSNGTVKAEQKISDTVGGFGGVLDDNDGFGSRVSESWGPRWGRSD